MYLRCAGLSADNINLLDDSIQVECDTTEEVKVFCYLEYTINCEVDVERAFPFLIEMERDLILAMQKKCQYHKKGYGALNLHSFSASSRS